MSGKYAKKNKKKKRKSTNPVVPILVTLVVILVIGIAAMLLLRPDTNGESGIQSTQAVETTLPLQASAQTTEATQAEENNSEPISLPYDLGSGLMLTDISNYAGLYLEDGTDEPVSGILMITLENTTGRDLQYAHIELIYQGQSASFQITNLPADRKIVVLEQNRMAHTPEMPVDVKTNNLAFVEDFEMCEDKIQVGPLNGALNIQNISGEDIPGNIVIYYKNVAGDLLFGGITYRITIEGGLQAEEIRQVMSAHFNADSSEIVMINCGG